MLAQLRRSVSRLAVVAATAEASPALGQEPGADAAEAGVRVFEPQYYAEFDPVTAIDLVFRTPGFNPEESDGGRGLSGVRSNVLIDGERPPPKGRSAEQRLREMPVDRIERVELIDAGARLDLDMQGFAQVLNVVTTSNPPAYYEFTTAIRREGTGDQRQDNERSYEVEGTGSFFWRQHEFTLSAEAEDNGSRSPSGFLAIDPANPEQRITGLNRSNGTEQGVELGALFDLPNESSLSFNGQFSSEEGSSSPFEFEGPDSNLAAVSETFADDESNRDMAAEYRRPLGAGGTLMVALVDARFTERSEESFASDELERASFEDSESGETAVRLMVTRTPTSRLTLRATATSALNYFEGGFRLLENGVELPVEGSDSRVEEDRRSVEGSVDWNLTDRWTLRGTLGLESHEIETRDISSGVQTDPKGQISVSFRPQPRTTLTLESTRQIGQLSFGQFLASASLSSEILSAGAVSLEPERSWSHVASYDRRFGDVGVMRFELTRAEIENPVGTVALSESVIVAQNTFPQTIDQLRASIEFPFEALGREDLILSTELVAAQSATVDPVTLESRDVSNITSRYWSVGLRRDPGDGRLAWGFSMSGRTEGLDYSVRRIRDSSVGREWEAYVEWEPVEGLKLRTSVEGPSENAGRSLFYATVRAPGLDPSFIAATRESVDRSASFSVEWRRRENFEITASVSRSPKQREEESLMAFGGLPGPILATETATTPQAEIEFRFFR